MRSVHALKIARCTASAVYVSHTTVARERCPIASGSEEGNRVMPNREGVSDASGYPSAGMSRLGGVCAISVAAVLLASLLSFFIALPGLGFQNWLVVLFKLNAGTGGLPVNPLRVLNPLDLAVLVLVGITFLGLRPALQRVSKAWTAIAVAMPFAGIALFAITRLAGRSTVMGAGLVIAFLMLRGTGFSRSLAYTGILTNAFLLVADFATGPSPAPLVAVLVGIGYVLLVAWVLMIGAWLLG
jgi:hypothetical protein